MMHDDDERRLLAEVATRDGALSRRQILAAAGLAAGAGLVPAEAATDPDRRSGRRVVGIGPEGATAVEFRARLAQTGDTGEHFVAYGYLTAAQGAADDDLFAAQVQSDGTALWTAHAVGGLVRRTVDQSVHALDIEGTMTIYQRDAPGATFALPDSFQIGKPVARFAISLQDIVTVFAPGKGIPTLNGDMEQTLADVLSGQQGRVFGRVGSRARLFATGLGTLLDAVRLNSQLEIAGHWTIQ